jgi:hypothetical protein
MCEYATDVKRFVRRSTGMTFKDWIEQEYAPDENETFSETCSRHADSVRFFIECVYEMLKDEYSVIFDKYYKALLCIYNNIRSDDDIFDLHVSTTVIAVERRILTPIYDYVEFFVTCTGDAYKLDDKIMNLRGKIRKCSTTLGISIEEVFDAIESESNWKRPVELINTIGNLRQPAEMLSRFMATMNAIVDTYEEEEKKRLIPGENSSNLQPDPIGADDFVPILIAILVRSNLKKSQTSFQMMSNVGSAYITNGKTKYYLTMLESVLYYLSTQGEEVVSDLQNKVRLKKKNTSIQSSFKLIRSYKTKSVSSARTSDLSARGMEGATGVSDNNVMEDSEKQSPTVVNESQYLSLLEDRLRTLRGNICIVQSLAKTNQRSIIMLRKRVEQNNAFQTIKSMVF